MIERRLQKKLLELIGQFPVVALLGPRQSGKTTLAQAACPDYEYVNLEIFEEREFAERDGRGFLQRYAGGKGVIIDEIQKAPSLLSYIQVEVDRSQKTGRFLITGSQNILVNQHVSQTLAGRVALLTLLPLEIQELSIAGQLPDTAMEAIFKGFYPRIYRDRADPVVWAESYIRTYVERDVRDIKNIESLSEFQKFMRLCAGRIGQLLNISSLANEAGLSLVTVKSWLSILEACYIIFRLQPHHANFNKRLVKMPKLYFYDTALACHLLKIHNVEGVYDHYLRGGLFESMILSDFIKQRHNRCLPPNAYFWRDKSGHEVDCILEDANQLRPVEIKSSATISPDFFESLEKWARLAGVSPATGTVVYGGDIDQKRAQGHALSWKRAWEA
jgi:hypothetical protein